MSGNQNEREKIDVFAAAFDEAGGGEEQSDAGGGDEVVEPVEVVESEPPVDDSGEPAAEPVEADHDWKQRWSDLKTHADETIPALRREIEELRAAQLVAQEPVVEDPPLRRLANREPETLDELLEVVPDDPTYAFQYAVSVDPSVVPDVIERIRVEHGDAEAFRAQTAFNEFIVDQRVQQAIGGLAEQYQPLQDQHAQQQAYGYAEQVASEFLSGIPNDEVKALTPAIQQKLQADWGDVVRENPTLMPKALRAAYAEAKAEYVAAQQSAAGRDAAAKQSAVAEIGNPGVSTVGSPEDEYADQARKEILARFTNAAYK